MGELEAPWELGLRDIISKGGTPYTRDTRTKHKVAPLERGNQNREPKTKLATGDREHTRGRVTNHL